MCLSRWFRVPDCSLLLPPLQAGLCLHSLFFPQRTLARQGREARRTEERLQLEGPDTGALRSSSRKLSTQVRHRLTTASALSRDPTRQSYQDNPALRSGPSLLLALSSLTKWCLSRGRLSGHTHLAFHWTFQHTFPPRHRHSFLPPGNQAHILYLLPPQV